MKLRPFELILLIVFGLTGVIAVIILSVVDPDSGAAPEDTTAVSQPVVIWGEFDRNTMNSLLRELEKSNQSFSNVRYYQKDARNFDFELINAIAERENPDLVLISHERLLEHLSKFYPISYEYIPERDFRDTYLDGANVFMLQQGVMAFPLMIDPLVMYWNRDMYATKGFISPPQTWEQVVSETVPTLVERDYSRRIITSPIAFGTYANIRNSYGVLSMLLLQGGSAMVTQQSEERFKVELGEQLGGEANPLTDSLSFYTRFATINNPLYSWNRTLAEDRQMFIAEDLATYFGFGSEAWEIEKLNPNLGFDISEVPGGETATVRRTYGEVYGFAILNEANSISDAYQIASMLTSPEVSQKLADAFHMAPARRSLVAAGGSDVYTAVIYDAAPVVRGWLNPDRDQVDVIFEEVTDDIHANRQTVSRAGSDVISRVADIID